MVKFLESRINMKNWVKPDKENRVGREIDALKSCLSRFILLKSCFKKGKNSYGLAQWSLPTRTSSLTHNDCELWVHFKYIKIGFICSLFVSNCVKWEKV